MRMLDETELDSVGLLIESIATSLKYAKEELWKHSASSTNKKKIFDMLNKLDEGAYQFHVFINKIT